MDGQSLTIEQNVTKLSAEVFRLQDVVRRLEMRRRRSYPLYMGLLLLGCAAVWAADVKRHDPSADGTQTVTAPFAVVDADGKTLLSVEATEDGTVFKLTGTDGDRVISMIAGGHSELRIGSGGDTNYMGLEENYIEMVRDNSGFTLGANGADQTILRMYGASGQSVKLQSVADAGQLLINDHGKLAAQLMVANGGGQLVVSKSSDPTSYVTAAANTLGLGVKVRANGRAMSWLGASEDGTGGQAFVYAGGARQVAGLQTYGGGKGQVSVWNGAGLPIASLAESDKHPGGSVTATDGGGIGVFSAGATNDGGDVCVNHKDHLRCLGSGLPLQVQ